jgi:hypothetical protein
MLYVNLSSTEFLDLSSGAGDAELIARVNVQSRRSDINLSICVIRAVQTATTVFTAITTFIFTIK